VLERAKKKMEELEKLLEIAVNNYIQLGGSVTAGQRKQHENKNTKRCSVHFYTVLCYGIQTAVDMPLANKSMQRYYKG